MPSKRRTDKRRPVLTPESWHIAFISGHDYFGTLDALELDDPLSLPPDSDARSAAQAAWDDAIGDAWALYGGAFMASWRPAPGLALPWAAVRFGLPGAN